jgi:hypothetical protein
MKKTFLTVVLMTLLGFAFDTAIAQNKVEEGRLPDSAYMEQEEKKPSGGGGLLDFLPFMGGRSKPVPPEDLTPSPRPQKAKPVLSDKDLKELRMAAERWLVTSEFTEPTVREAGDGRYYRDYIVFAREYEVEVLRGKGDETPFLANVYVDGDYFKTSWHLEAKAAESDYDFKHDKLEFRLVFERVEKWEYSDNPNEDPIVFRELWEFRKLQSRPKLASRGDQAPGTPSAAGSADIQQPSGK